MHIEILIRHNKINSQVSEAAKENIQKTFNLKHQTNQPLSLQLDTCPDNVTHGAETAYYYNVTKKPL